MSQQRPLLILSIALLTFSLILFAGCGGSGGGVTTTAQNNAGGGVGGGAGGGGGGVGGGGGGVGGGGGSGGAGGGGGGVVVNQPPILFGAFVDPVNVDFSGLPPVTISVNVNDDNLDAVTVTATVLRQSDGAVFAVTNFTRALGVFTGTFSAPPNIGSTFQVYGVTISATDGVNPSVNVQSPNIIVSVAPPPPPPPLP